MNAPTPSSRPTDSSTLTPSSFLRGTPGVGWSNCIRTLSAVVLLGCTLCSSVACSGEAESASEVSESPLFGKTLATPAPTEGKVSIMYRPVLNAAYPLSGGWPETIFGVGGRRFSIEVASVTVACIENCGTTTSYEPIQRLSSDKKTLTLDRATAFDPGSTIAVTVKLAVTEYTGESLDASVARSRDGAAIEQTIEWSFKT